MRARISPSILAADFANLESALKTIKSADSVHVDVMDNHFVPNLTIGMPVVERLKQVSPVPLDLHLMISDPDSWAPKYAVGVYSTTFHFEAAEDAVATARAIRSTGSLAGVALRPDTPLEAISDNLGEFDQVLIMTVEPGFGGQAFRADTMSKLHALAKIARPELSIQVDGGINTTTIKTAASNGANNFVAGTAVFGSSDPAAAINNLRDLAQTAMSGS